MGSLPNLWLLVGLVILDVTVLILDLVLPLGVAVGMLYVLPIFLSLWLAGRRYTLVAAIVGTILVVVGFVFGHAELLWIGLFNRGLILGLIWATTVVVLLWKGTQEEIKMLAGLVPICASCKKIRNDRGFWDSVELYMQKRSGLQFTHGICPECAEHYHDERIAGSR